MERPALNAAVAVANEFSDLVYQSHAMLTRFKTNAEHREALSRVREWTRMRFGLPEDAAILVAEVACGLPGCPPRETVVAFWTADAARHHFKVFKEVAHVIEDDLPPSFMKAALADREGFGCDCC